MDDVDGVGRQGDQRGDADAEAPQPSAPRASAERRGDQESGSRQDEQVGVGRRQPPQRTVVVQRVRNRRHEEPAPAAAEHQGVETGHRRQQHHREPGHAPSELETRGVARQPEPEGGQREDAQVLDAVRDGLVEDLAQSQQLAAAPEDGGQAERDEGGAAGRRAVLLPDAEAEPEGEEDRELETDRVEQHRAVPVCLSTGPADSLSGVWTRPGGPSRFPSGTMQPCPAGRS